jgi:hypothetical protein
VRDLWRLVWGLWYVFHQVCAKRNWTYYLKDCALQWCSNSFNILNTWKKNPKTSFGPERERERGERTRLILKKCSLLLHFFLLVKHKDSKVFYCLTICVLLIEKVQEWNSWGPTSSSSTNRHMIMGANPV